MLELVCIDVDGTLVGSSGAVRPAIWAAAERARARGVRLALCSGRPAFGLARGYAERLDPEGWHIFQNGASVLHLQSGRSLSSPLPAATVAHLVARAGAAGRVLELYMDREYAVESDGEQARRHADLLGLPFAPRPFASLTGPVVRAQWLVPAADTDAVLAEPAHGLERSPSTSPVMPGTVFINMTAAGVDKASGVRAVAAALGVDLARVMFVGDGHNDVAAMGVVGAPVAMGNADPVVRAAARRVVGPVDEDGLAEALDLAG